MDQPQLHILQKISNNYDTLYTTTEFSDIKIKVGEKYIKAHKLVLIANNPVFKNMFIHPTLEEKNSILEINDFDFETVNAFIKYLYTGKSREQDLTVNLLLLADKYLDFELKSLCDEHLSKKVNEENAIECLLFSFQTFTEKIKNAASAIIAESYEEFKLLPSFQNVLSNLEAVNAIFSQFPKIISREFFTLK